MTEYKLVVIGLNPLRRDLRALSRDAPKALQRGNKRAAEMVLPFVRKEYGRHFRVGGSGRGRRSTAGIRAVATQTKAGIRIGGKRFPHLPGQEFGSNRLKQFAPWTGKAAGGRGSVGRFLYPTISDLTPEIVKIYFDALEHELKKAFPERR